MLINEQSLGLLTQAVRANFYKALETAKPTYKELAMEIPSSTAENVYPYIEQLGRIREWVGDRVIQNLSKKDFRIANKKYERTHSIERVQVEDDQFGLNSVLMTDVGEDAANFPDRSAYELLKSGFNTVCPDGQYFFDTDHPVGRPGSEASVSNFMGGTGEAWFLVDASKA
jgi:phage major head subunit gpT-like protein